ncbi:MAG: glycosyltransferase family 4 protein [Candidatus Omnitrophica bacterium]|nr:glycosyltransferase family 4 protein [Candidatus Omnitrophota bacterium]MBU4457979.1 glycosyltransferase family 4 protein [Candidatus Omnitrophota bacterium]
MAKKNRSLKIAQFHWGFPPMIGGVETHLTILLSEMVRMGHKVDLLTGAAEGAKAVDRYKGVGVYRVPIMDLNWLAKRGLNGLLGETEKVFTGFLKRTRPDIIHCHNMHYFSKPHTRTLARLSREFGVPLVLTAHNVWDDNLFLDLARNIKWDHIIAVSHFIKRELIGIGVPHKKITTVHHGIDEQLYNPKIKYKSIFKKYPQLKNKKIVFHPARMGLAKGCDVSIKALRRIKDRIPNIMLILAGTKNIIDWAQSQQKDIAYMVDLVDFFNMRKNVLIDAFDLTDMPKLYAASDVCVYPSTASEPFGLTMLEALSSAKPMVVTETGGMPEIIKDGINGFVVPIRDFEALASRVIQLISNKELHDRLGYTGRQMVEQNYTKEIVTRKTLDVYKSLL